MERTKKAAQPAGTRSQAQKKADERYSERNRAKNRENQKANYKNISATIKREKAERIAAIYKAHGVSVAEVVNAAAGYLTEHGDEGAERIKAAAARYNAIKAEEPADDREDAPGDPGRE